jgi:hypothetical protein
MRLSPTRWTLIALSTAAVLVLGNGPSADAKKPQPASCQGGYWVIDGAPLLPGAAGPDGLVIYNGAVSTISGCPETPAKVFRSKGKNDKIHDQLVVKWKTCGSVKRAVLRATIAHDCSSVTGQFSAKRVRGRQFSAHDGVPTDLRVPYGDGLPDGAAFVSPVEFIDASTRSGFRLLSATQGAEDEAAAAEADAENQAVLDDFAAAHPDRIDFVSMGVDPTDPDLQSTEDGNYGMVVHDEDGNPVTVVTQGRRYHRAILADTIRTFPTQENQLAVYRQLWDFAHERLDPSLPSPDDMAEAPADELAAMNRSISEQSNVAEQEASYPGEGLSASYPSRCSNEIGSGDGTDGSGYCRHTPGGLYSTATWPLKYFDTCVKNQANRGACVAFATTAGREMRVAQKYDRWMNLSEEHLYFMAKRVYQPAEYGDGLGASTLLGQLFTANYEQPLEQQWDYNPSNSRTDDDKNKKYTMSCTDYGGAEQAYCSDTAHQGRVICMQQGTNVVCGVSSPSQGATTVRSVEQPAELWDAEDPVNGLGNVIVSLLNHVPLVLGLTVTKGFDSPTTDGYVRLRGNRFKLCREVAIDPKVPDVTGCEETDDCECPMGGHAVLAVGYIPQAKLPPGTPSSTGGFLIIKNSWGCVADGGYFYLPAAWARAFIHSARPVGDVEVAGALPDQPMDNFTFDFRPAPPSIDIVQPLPTDFYVAGQGIPLVAEGVDYQFDQWALNGAMTWTSDIDGNIGSGQTTIATLSQGDHTITARYTGKLGVVATASTTLFVAPKPPDIPPTAVFTKYVQLSDDAQCPGPCSGSGTCIVGFGNGTDPEDGLLTDTAHVRWYLQVGNGPRLLGSSGASAGNQGKYIGCPRLCGAVFKFVLEVEDSKGQKAESRRELATSDCVN